MRPWPLDDRMGSVLQDKIVDHWLRNEVVPAYKMLKAEPASGSTLEDVRGALAERHASGKISKLP